MKSKNKKGFRLRHTNNNVCLARTFSCKLVGGVRGYYDCMALETFSNDTAPTIKTIMGFTYICEIKEKI